MGFNVSKNLSLLALAGLMGFIGFFGVQFSTDARGWLELVTTRHRDAIFSVARAQDAVQRAAALYNQDVQTQRKGYKAALRFLSAIRLIVENLPPELMASEAKRSAMLGLMMSTQRLQAGMHALEDAERQSMFQDSRLQLLGRVEFEFAQARLHLDALSRPGEGQETLAAARALFLIGSHLDSASRLVDDVKRAVPDNQRGCLGLLEFARQELEKVDPVLRATAPEELPNLIHLREDISRLAGSAPRIYEFLRNEDFKLGSFEVEFKAVGKAWLDLTAQVRQFETGLIQRFEGESERLMDTAVARGKTLMGVTSAGFAAALLLSYMLNRLIQRRVGALIQGVDAYAAGDYERRLEASTGDELGRVATAFNQMAARLSEKDALLSNRLDDLRQNEARLTLALGEIKRISNTKSDFLARMSHDFRTPLNAIVNLTDEAMRSPSPERLQSFLTTVKSASEHLRRLVDDILDVSKIEAGAMTLIPENCNLAALLDECVSALARLARQKNLDFGLDIDSCAGVWVRCDPMRMRQIILNLLGNAIKFTTEGEVRVRCAMRQREDDPGLLNVVIAVRDTGVGVPPEQREAIFEVFSQGEADNSRRFGGTGLGLAICRYLARMMDGDVMVESEIGKGSVFSASLTLPRGEAPCEDTRCANLGAAQRCPPGLRLLVAEDNEFNHQVMAALLDRMGHCFEVAPNGQVAIDKLKAERFDAVLMDVEMPVLDGFEATRRIRQGVAGEAASGMPIIALTAHAIEGFEGLCLQAGMNGYVTKPINPDLLDAALASHVAAGKTRLPN